MIARARLAKPAWKQPKFAMTFSKKKIVEELILSQIV
jgi:hypothetical protein